MAHVHCPALGVAVDKEGKQETGVKTFKDAKEKGKRKKEKRRGQMQKKSGFGKTKKKERTDNP